MKIMEIETQSVKSKKSKEERKMSFNLEHGEFTKIGTKTGIAEKPCLPVKRLIEI